MAKMKTQQVSQALVGCRAVFTRASEMEVVLAAGRPDRNAKSIFTREYLSTDSASGAGCTFQKGPYKGPSYCAVPV